MQHQSPPVSHSSSRYTCPSSNLSPKAPIFAFNIEFYDTGPNEIDPLDCSCLSDDIRDNTSTPGDFTFSTHGSAIVLPAFERQRYSTATHSNIHTSSLSVYTETPSTSDSTTSPVLLRSPRSPHMCDVRHSHPLRDRRAYGLITQTVFSADPFSQNALPLTYSERFIRKIKTTSIPYLRAIGPPKSVELSKRILHPPAPRPRP